MEKNVLFDELGQKMTQKFKHFSINVDFSQGRLSAEFDFEEQKISLSDYQTILKEFAELDNRLSALAACKKPLSELTVSEFMQVVESIE